VAHVAFPDHSALGVVLRDAVRAVPRAVLAPDAGIGAMPHDAGNGILRIGVNGTSMQTRRFEAVIASHREKRTRRHREPAAFDLLNPPPVDRGRVAVLLVTGDDTALAPDALAHVDVKAVLLAGPRRAQWHPRGRVRAPRIRRRRT